MARKSTDAYKPDQSTGTSRLILPGIAAAVTLFTMVYLFVFAETEPSPTAVTSADTGPTSKASRPPRGAADCDNCPIMVQIPTGTFVMGLTRDETVSDRVPQIHVQTETPPIVTAITNPFAISALEVTRGQFADFVADTGREINGCVVRNGAQWVYDDRSSWRDPGFSQTDEHPVVCVSYNDAEEYVLWLRQRTLNPYRLPDETEWEFVARAGTEASRPWGDVPENACEHANVAGVAFQRTYGPLSERLTFPCDTEYPETAPAGQFRASAFGLHDVFGNARERIGGCWTPNHRQQSSTLQIDSVEDCEVTIVKGGGWADPPANLRTPRRLRAVSTERRADTGFRVVKDLPLNQSQN